MTREEENKMLLEVIAENVEHNPKGTYEEMVSFNLGTIGSVLADISKSLAVITDKVESEDKE